MPRDALPQIGARFLVQIDGLDDEGRGRSHLAPDAGESARIDLAVRGAFPGDQVEVIIERVFPARRLAVGRCTRLLEAGAARQDARCSHRAPTVCCPLDGLEFSAQLALKQERVRQALRDVDLPQIAELVEDVKTPPTPTGRRQKVKLIAAGAAGDLQFGLYAPWSRTFVRADACVYHRPELNRAISTLRCSLNACGVAPAMLDPAGLKAIVLRAFAEGVGAVLVLGSPLPDAAWERLQDAFWANDWVALDERIDDGVTGSLVGGVPGRHLGRTGLTPLEGGGATTADAFCQPDPALARWMYAEVAAFAASAPSTADATPRFFVDAYAGTGGFSRALIEAGERQVVAVERAAANLPALFALGIDAVGASVEDALPQLRARGRPAAVIADPPKKGLGDAARPLAALAASRLALVSCDPDAMARDVAVWVEAGYEPLRVIPVDLFTGTPEVEVISLLERRAARSDGRS